MTLKTFDLLSVYTASKAAVNALTEVMALELAAFGIQSHVVLPGQAPGTAYSSMNLSPVQPRQSLSATSAA
ncbi:SDR family NAD(P)-dependent oxidoreductase [Sagittula stellata]|uniref:Probable dehydrogenase protein n=1 Tax=Sagittula stellata (strain ATCC 700073 / DSM 11524 / E-37) TaxID=388399 RepID=A3K4Q3_SAGS3|nr:probable dehydrogenase protein [Sagittula stellata E-37]